MQTSNRFHGTEKLINFVAKINGSLELKMHACLFVRSSARSFVYAFCVSVLFFFGPRSVLSMVLLVTTLRVHPAVTRLTACRRPYVNRRVVAPKGNNGRGQKSRRRRPDPMMRFGCSRSDCSRMKP